MSISPSNPHGAPSLAEVLITRTFAKPTNPFVDGEFLQALDEADSSDETRAAVDQAASGTGAGTESGTSSSSHDGAGTAAGKIIDVRA